ncbi:MAG TPA: cytochrome c [Beijerinckiaceae bacterium]|nr:cytochrome c [Beijerinckiaceae bacterium]
MLRILGVLIALAAAGAAEAQDSGRDIRLGKRIAEKNCANCHSIGLKGASTRKGAPPFRTLHRRYDLDNLQEALVEGVAVGHRGADMPEFTFTPDQTDALIAYLKSLKGR